MDIVRNTKKSFVDFFGNIKIYPGGIVLFGSSTYKIKGPHMREILNLVEPGDILINRKDHYVSNFFIDGNFSHAGLYVGADKVIHVVGDGIKEEDILTFMRADAFAVARPLDKDTIPEAIARAHRQLAKGVQYDYDFDKNSPEEFYCSEFTDYCYDHVMRDNIVKDKYILPDVYAMNTKYFEVIWLKN